MHLEIPHQIKQMSGLLLPLTMHVSIYLNHIYIETTNLLMKTHSIYPVAVENIEFHYKPSLSLYRLLLMQLDVKYSCQLSFYQMIRYQVMIWCIETMIKCWEQDVDIQILMKCHSCYKTRDNAEVTLRHAVVVVPVSTQINQPCIHKYWDFHYWWTAVA